MEQDRLNPLREKESNPSSLDLASPCSSSVSQYSLEKISEALFSVDHLKVIFDDSFFFRQIFGDFLHTPQPKSVPPPAVLSRCIEGIENFQPCRQSLAQIQGLEYALGRNCRFLQGPYTSRISAKRE
ncbi:uncharacterized protein GGS22DRAFT_76679 [Annulohypoxylon maeteangense]|uniref:uncharacterized protein n=1 Tax=Annulohypoxylon maeteangense TaxID=1927788 RepID=UPI00200724D9|nr:uncharacterized protein GGS22DRAFT_76679 [Annulohypoxylon maeteangense]KAI0881167.1 hypothetical protein GGS22DRAFT_76679 [Annulohypoxylon maeteangense]